MDCNEGRINECNKEVFIYVLMYVFIYFPIPVAAQSKAWVCGHSHFGIVGSNLAGDMDISLVSVVCVVR